MYFGGSPILERRSSFKMRRTHSPFACLCSVTLWQESDRRMTRGYIPDAALRTELSKASRVAAAVRNEVYLGLKQPFFRCCLCRMPSYQLNLHTDKPSAIPPSQPAQASIYSTHTRRTHLVARMRAQNTSSVRTLGSSLPASRKMASSPKRTHGRECLLPAASEGTATYPYQSSAQPCL